MKPEKPILKLNNWLLPVLVSILILMQIFTPYKGWMALLVGLGGLWAISAYWAYSLRKKLSLTREMRFGWAQVGDRLIERFNLVNDASLPALWIEVRDLSTLPGYRASRGTGVASRSSIRWHRESLCSRRGLFYLGPTEVLTGDPFGVYTVTLHYPASLPLLVLPPIVPLPTIEVAPGGRSGEGRPRADAQDRIVSASSARPYYPGDSRRWIHWKLSARRDELFVRLFDGMPAGDWWILLDMDARVQVGEGEDSTDELGVILAASLADRGLRARRAVGLLAHGEDLVWLPPRSGEGQRWEILRTLALVNRGRRSLAELLQRVRPSLGQRTTLIIITAAVEGLWLETLIPLLRHNVVPTVLLMDPVSFGGAGDTAAARATLNQLGVANAIISQDLLDHPKAHPGTQGQWEWKVLGTGKAVPVQRSTSDSPWRALS
ncbi:MAG: DUF58 domain-containing protein [Anaerolineae bacterium]|nr:DUF58 domain-containing protein [Anaerolineae bacterium]